eukprot:gnl/TRDRNA2_/TRDRNA2_77813_c1_seq1.p1 gnl/TRDRNA2_/TRDRNA2_77813_c1~~gnl/TRDRNA2_/TRDRNA2_77813_c1_seq1.p1  ORF type:complete len:253 (+),score=47.57 gnl/TRDRNA2_/TRDRNA2_77813_c1_seq1:42-761(+)
MAAIQRKGPANIKKVNDAVTQIRQHRVRTPTKQYLPSASKGFRRISWGRRDVDKPADEQLPQRPRTGIVSAAGQTVGVDGENVVLRCDDGTAQASCKDLFQLLDTLDSMGDGTVRRDEFIESLSSADAAIVSSLGIPEAALQNRPEMPRLLGAIFDEADHDKDRVVTVKEFQHFMHARVNQHAPTPKAYNETKDWTKALRPPPDSELFELPRVPPNMPQPGKMLGTHDQPMPPTTGEEP